jgi:hypothetical protein
MSRPKELLYFNRLDQQGRPNANYTKPLDWYLRHFAGATGHTASGEISPDYLTSLPCAARIYRRLGTVRIVATLRNPTDRFVSHYRHCIRRGLLPKQQFRRLNLQTMETAIERLPNLFRNGLYHTGLQQYTDVFGAERVCVITKDEIDADPLAVVRRVYQFLGVDPSFTPGTLFRQVGWGTIPRSQFVEALRMHLYGLAARHAPQLINHVKSCRLSDLYRWLNSESPEGDVVVEPPVRSTLCQRYAPDVALTERLLGRSLTAWRGQAETAEAA